MTSYPAFRGRLFHNDNDYALMRGLLSDVLRRMGPPVYLTVGDLDWSRAVDDDDGHLRQTRLWFDGSRLVAFAWPEEGQAEIIVHPDYPALFDAALDWCVDYYQSTTHEGSTPGFMLPAFTRDTPRRAALRKRGFRLTEMGRVVYGQRIGSPIASPPPPGYILRHVAGEAESEARAAVQRAAFESDFMTAARHRRVQAMPTYRPELDLVAVAADGEMAAFALVWLDETNHLGVFEPLGVAVHHQRRGLGRALMAEGLRRLAALGATYACVGTGIAETPARGLYEAAGFVALDYSHMWRNPAGGE